MKKTIFVLIFAMAGLLFAGVQSVNAQVNYSFWVEWDDTECDGGTILEKRLEWKVIYIATQAVIGSDVVNVTSSSNPYEVLAYGNVIYDCPNCYEVSARVSYRDSTGWFCTGDDSVICDGDELVDGDQVYLYVDMY